MAAAHHHVPPRSYNSPPPISTSDPTANECKLVDYRGQKVAAFIIAGDTMLCLPQAFELFLKHLVGGLHTVYTKLKRLDIVPLVCNVEQVRILRGLGAIQPGVNRCKLLSCKDFDILYRDCTTARYVFSKKPKKKQQKNRQEYDTKPNKRNKQRKNTIKNGEMATDLSGLETQLFKLHLQHFSIHFTLFSTFSRCFFYFVVIFNCDTFFHLLQIVFLFLCHSISSIWFDYIFCWNFGWIARKQNENWLLS